MIPGEPNSLQWYELIFELIDLRSFSNLWFWVALAVMWSATTQRVLGVPFDMIVRARRHGGQAQEDMETMLRLSIRRMLQIAQTSGLWLVGFTTFLLVSLGLSGFAYGLEFAQALFLLALPLAIVGALSLRCAAAIAAEDLRGEELDRRLMRHRTAVQMVGAFSIFVTSMYGMWVNVRLGALG